MFFINTILWYKNQLKIKILLNIAYLIFTFCNTPPVLVNKPCRGCQYLPQITSAIFKGIHFLPAPERTNTKHLKYHTSKDHRYYTR
jgi:hypothetical protein